MSGQKGGKHIAMEKTDEKNIEEKTPCPENDALTFQENADHLKFGYENSQATVRFLDAKASGVLGLVPVTIGLLITTFRWIGGWPKWDHIIGFVPTSIAVLLTTGTLVALCVALFHGIRSLKFALTCLLPRDLGASTPSILFPYRRSGDTESRDVMADRINLFVGNPKKEDLFEDYRNQLDRMASIVGEKMTAVQRSVRQMSVFLAWSGVTVAAILMTSCANSLAAQEPVATPSTTSEPIPLSTGRSPTPMAGSAQKNLSNENPLAPSTPKKADPYQTGLPSTP